MWRPILIIIVIFAALYGAYHYVNKPEVSDTNSTPINTEKDPFQSMMRNSSSKSFESRKLNLTISQISNYSISARILGKRKYVRGWESKISKWDLVLGWGDASKIDKIKNLEINQTVRWYNYKISSDIPMTQSYIATHTSNHHIIPDNENVRKAILFLKKLDVVHMKGYLVNVHGVFDGTNVSWLSSLSRNDTGIGACEIFLVTSIRIDDKIYE